MSCSALYHLISFRPPALAKERRGRLLSDVVICFGKLKQQRRRRGPCETWRIGSKILYKRARKRPYPGRRWAGVCDRPIRQRPFAKRPDAGYQYKSFHPTLNPRSYSAEHGAIVVAHVADAPAIDFLLRQQQIQARAELLLSDR